MNFQNTRRSRHGSSWRGVGIGIGVGIALLLFILLVFPGQNSSDRVSVVVATSPMAVWSWNTTDNTFIVFTVPSDYVIDALYGYGNYSLGALWRLGFIDKKGGLLLSDSLSDTMGLTIPWYMGVKSQAIPDVPDTFQYGRQLFSLLNIFPVLEGRYQTNMPVGLFIFFSRALAAARSDNIQRIDAMNLNVVNREQLPDGSTRDVISPDFLDHALGGVFQNDAIRAEGLSVAVYNTTAIPALGNRAARILTNAGVLVVTVGNDEPPLTQCELIGDAHPLSSKTAQYIVRVFGCKKIVSGGDKRADLTVRLGNDYAGRFAPSGH